MRRKERWEEGFGDEERGVWRGVSRGEYLVTIKLPKAREEDGVEVEVNIREMID